MRSNGIGLRLDPYVARLIASERRHMGWHRPLCEAYPVDSDFSRCSVLSDRIGAVARAYIDGEGAVARGIPEVISR